MQEIETNRTDNPTGGHRPSGNLSVYVDLPAYIGGCPSAEMLAAYIDGVLNPVEAERVTAHLADCEDCYAVYSDSVRFLLETDPEEEGTVVPFPARVPKSTPPKRAPSPWYYKIAALLVVGVGAYAILNQLVLGPPPDLKTLEIAQRIPTRPEVFDNTRGLWTGPVFRGGEGEPESDLDEAAFRAGVQLVNLQVSLRAEKKDEAQNAVAALLGLLDSGIMTRGAHDEVLGPDRISPGLR